MTEKNYAAWNLNIDTFLRSSSRGEQIEFIAKCGLLAPSTHNTQPWEFTLDGDSVGIYSSKGRLLPVADKEGNLLAVSMGACVESMVISALSAGYSTTVTLEPHLQAGDRYATLMFQKSITPPEPPDILHALLSRRTNRSIYSKVPIKSSLLAELTSTDFPSLVSALAFSDKSDKSTIADVLLSARELLFDNPKFRREMARYKRTNLTSQFTGMPGFTMGFSLLPSLIAPLVIKYVNVIRKIRKHEVLLLTEDTPTLMFICTKTQSREDAFLAGRTYLRMTVIAEQHGVATAISAVPRESPLLQTALRTSLYPQLMVRIGYAGIKPHHSPRFSLSSVLKQ